MVMDVRDAVAHGIPAPHVGVIGEIDSHAVRTAQAGTLEKMPTKQRTVSTCLSENFIRIFYLCNVASGLFLRKQELPGELKIPPRRTVRAFDVVVGPCLPKTWLILSVFNFQQVTRIWFALL